MWTVIEQPPQPYGECGLCKRHTCGEYTDEDGVSRQKWLHTPLEMDQGGKLVIGYQCAQSMSEELGISKRVVEKQIFLTPTDQQIADYIKTALQFNVAQEDKINDGTGPTNHIETMSRDELRAILDGKKVSYFKGLPDEKLRELAMQNV